MSEILEGCSEQRNDNSRSRPVRSKFSEEGEETLKYKIPAVLLLVVFSFALALAPTSYAQDGPSSSKNPLQVATLHWYDANQTTQFSVAGFPTGVVFDGENLWIASTFGNTITKLRPSDGTTLA